MSDASRQQRRKAVREQLKTGTRLTAAGLPLRPKRDQVIAVARVVATKLAERDNPRRASEAAALTHALFEASLAGRPASSRIVCRKGCSYCCHQFVGASPPEVFRIAGEVLSARRPDLDAASVVGRAAPLHGLTAEQRVGAGLPCPLLVDSGGAVPPDTPPQRAKLCGVYAERPLVCRQTTSFDLAACAEEFTGTNMAARIEVSPAHLDHAGTASVVLLGSLVSAGLPTECYELSAALSVVLGDPLSEQRWLAGEPIFTGLAPVPRAPQMEGVARAIAAALAG